MKYKIGDKVKFTLDAEKTISLGIVTGFKAGNYFVQCIDPLGWECVEDSQKACCGYYIVEDASEVSRDTKADRVNEPLHYTQGGIQPLDYIISNKMDFLEGNVIKYVTRHKFKNGLEDLKKAKVYLEKLIESYEKE